MNTNLFFETMVILFAILVSNGILFSVTISNLNLNSSENISVITNSSEKDGLTLIALLPAYTLSITSSEDDGSEIISLIPSETNVTNVSQDIINPNGIDYNWEIHEGIHVNNSNLLSRSNNDVLWPFNEDDVIDNITSKDSITILNSQTFEQWREIAMDLHEMPANSPANILQQIKFEELNILYSQDIIQFSISQIELRLIIEQFPAYSLFYAEVNHMILTVMSMYH